MLFYQFMGIIFSPVHFRYANILAIYTHMGPNKHSIFWNAHLLSKLYCQRAIQILIPSWTTFQMPHSAVYKVTPRTNHWKQIFQRTAVRADAPNIYMGIANNCTTPFNKSTPGLVTNGRHVRDRLESGVWQPQLRRLLETNSSLSGIFWSLPDWGTN